MSYIWINPVIDSMHDADVLEEFLCRHGHKRIHVSGDWGTVVKEKYIQAVHQTTQTVADVRCPKIKGLLEELRVAEQVVMPDIDPILIHCGQEISERKELRNEEKIITTPCQALADMGNSLGLTDTWFVPWNEFVRKIGEVPESVSLKESPIPPGFFHELKMKTVSITGEEEICRFFEDGMSDEVNLIEMLYCKDGCHNGDGIKLEQ